MEWTQQIVDDALRGKDRGGEPRVIEEIGFRLPDHIPHDILGVPDVENRDQLSDWTRRSLELIDAFLPDDRMKANIDASGQLAEHLREVSEGLEEPVDWDAMAWWPENGFRHGRARRFFSGDGGRRPRLARRFHCRRRESRE